MKRFYKQVEVAAVQSGFVVQLDGRTIKSPAKQPLQAPNRALADLVALEWDAQGDDIDPKTMPQTRYLGTAVDSFAGKRPETVQAIQAYSDGDLLSYWADEPEGLQQEQTRLWQPLLDWAATTYGVSVVTTTGIAAIGQSDDTINRLSAAVAACDDFRLVALSIATGSTGSLIIGLALSSGEIDGQTAFDAAQVEETFQISQWGEDSEATIRRDGQLAELQELQRYIAALGSV